jgi:exodeoxyribonuclease VII large subunit
MRLEALGKRKLETAKQALAEQISALEALNPLSVLKRAYSIVTDINGQTVSDAGKLKKGDRLKIQMAVGSALCTVDEVEK